MRTRNIIMMLVIAGIVLAGVLAGPMMSDVEQAKYTVVESHGTIELRDYEPLIVAEVQVTGPRKEAISQGFRMIADYIFGNNKESGKVAMTAPVIQQLGFVPEVKNASKKLSKGQPAEDVKKAYDAWGTWHVRFVMPASYTLATLPKPNNDAVKFSQVPAKRFAVIRFAGLAENDSLRERTTELSEFTKSKNLKTVGEPSYAFYNPPWTLSPLRRNEVMVEVVK